MPTSARDFAVQNHIATGDKCYLPTGNPEIADNFRWADVGIGPYGGVCITPLNYNLSYFFRGGAPIVDIFRPLCDNDLILIKVVFPTKKDYSISFVRMVAMLFIILCHMMQYLGIELAWWFNVGVQMFLFVSGYLYGKKQITNIQSFYVRNFKKILTDYYIYAIIIAGVIFLTGRVNYSATDIACFLLLRIRLAGLEHLWFIPYILICYILTPLLLPIVDKIKKKGDISCIITTVLFLIVMDLALESLLVGYNGAWFNCYILGLFYSACEDRKKVRKMLTAAFFVLCLLMNGVQIWIDYISDVSLGWFFAILHGKWSNYAHVLLGVCLVLALRWLFDRFRWPAAVTKLLDLSDTYSYDVYLVHQFFILGPYSVMGVFGKAIPGALLALALTAVSAFVLHTLSVLCRKKIPFSHLKSA